ncbi:MAG: DUF1850 domain-containing protein, partial [Spirochaetaceae bacterium]|jgi:hypothetical protein|nr:DUF1850 domain-containing protein [Spirochaetaceae bacterium]
VNNSPVRDTFVAEGRRIRPVEARYYSFGAGMPTSPEPGQIFTIDGDALVITGFTQSYTALNYIVGTVSDHVLGIGAQEVSLRDLCGRNAHIAITVK